MNKDAQGRWKVGMSNIKLKMRVNIVETLFGKMARTFLKRIRVESWAELRERILKGIAEINAAPVVHRWRKFESLEVT